MTIELSGQSNPYPGVFVTFEGGDGAGKTTHINFLSDSLRDRGYEVICVREPGGTAIGEQLRNIVLNPEHKNMSNLCELLIYEAARAQIVDEVIRPALQRGAVVLCDRFTDSTLAYQSFGRRIPFEYVEKLNNFVCEEIAPNRTILMTADANFKQSVDRAIADREGDRLELAGEKFHNDVNKGFATLAEIEPDRIRVVVSADKKSLTSKRIFKELEDLFIWMADKNVCNDAFFETLDEDQSDDSVDKKESVCG